MAAYTCGVAVLALALGGAHARSDDGFVSHVLSSETASQFGAACLAGDPPGFYYRWGAPGTTKWRLHFRGGGWCTTPYQCYSRLKSDGGSSAYFLPNISSTPNMYEGFMDDNSSNPFGEWNMVFLQYCDGSSWTSSRDEPVLYNGTAMWMRGANNLLAVMHELDAMAGLMTNATEVIMSGTSAGALMIYLTSWRVRQLLPATATLVGLPDSGFFLDYPNTKGQLVFQSWFQEAIGPDFWNATSGTNPDCIAAVSAADAWKCFFAEHVYEYLNIPFFVTNSAADAWQTENILQLPCDITRNCDANMTAVFNAFQSALQAAIIAKVASRSGDGAYISGCYQHGQTCSDPDWFNATIAGMSQNASFAAWYSGAPGNHTHVAPLYPDPSPQDACAVNAQHGWC